GVANALQEAVPDPGPGRSRGLCRHGMQGEGGGPAKRRQVVRGSRRRRRAGRGAEEAGVRRRSAGLVTSEVGRRAGEAWAFRTRVERDAARRFRRLAVAIAGFDSASPVPGLLAAAAGDEERHADLCAGLAAAYGQPAVEVGPDLGVAPQQLAPRDAALYEMVAACCITETES